MVFECHLGEGQWLASDASWKARRPDAWDHDSQDGRDMVVEGVPLELFDARRFDPGWKIADFNDAGWGQAQVVPAMHSGTCRSQPPTHPYGPLSPRPIGMLDGETRKPAVIRVETLEKVDIQPLASPMDRVDSALDSPRAGKASEGRLPLSLDVPGGGASLDHDRHGADRLGNGAVQA